MILFLAIVLIYATLDAWHDKYVIERNTKWHTIDAMIKAFLLACILLYPPIELNEAWRLLFVGFTTWWLYFDIALNLMRKPKLPWTHRGYNFLDQNGNNPLDIEKFRAGLIDKLPYRFKLPFMTWFTLKVILFGISIMIYFDIY